jgi:allantoin racemase
VGISLDCGLRAARERLAPQAVIGMTQAACLTALLHGPRFGLLTIGSAMAPLYRMHVESIGLGGGLVGIAAPDLTDVFNMPAGELSEAVLTALCEAGQGLLAQGAQSLVLAGAVLCGYAAALQARLACPVLDGMHCAVLQARVRLGSRRVR